MFVSERTPEGTHCESRILGQLKIRQKVFDFHTFEELVPADYAIWYTVLLQC